jgi:O-acetyl-ADP-ribose deacetylase (regulator of RNase III)
MSVVMKSGDLFESSADAFVNTVNCKGVMGAGIAKLFKEIFRGTGYFEDYVDKCRKGVISVGVPDIYNMPNSETGPRFLVNFPTKNHWRDKSSLEQIALGLDRLDSIVRERNIRSIAVPALGCTNGQLDWASVSSEMYRRLSKLDAHVEFFAPLGANEEGRQLPVVVARNGSVEADRLCPGPSLPLLAVALGELIHRIQQTQSGNPVSRDDLSALFGGLVSIGVTDSAIASTEAGSQAKLFTEHLQILENNWLIVRSRDSDSNYRSSFESGPTYLDARTIYSNMLTRVDAALQAMVDGYAPSKQLSFAFA